jgi:hypothetical protein
MSFINITVCQFSMLGAVSCMYAGYQWINELHGLHPIVAGACAMFFILAPHMISLAAEAFRSHDDVVDHLGGES